jgi:hypothetical protein
MQAVMSFSFNFFFALIASSFVMSSFLINLFVTFTLFFDLIVLSIYACDIGFDTVSTLSNSEGFNFLFVSFNIILYPSFLSIVYISLLNFCLPLSNFPFSSITLTLSFSLNGTDLYIL